VRPPLAFPPLLAALLLVPVVTLAACGGSDPPCPVVPIVPIGVFEPTGGFLPGCASLVSIVGDESAAVLVQVPDDCPIGRCRANDLSCLIADGYPCSTESGTVLGVIRGARAGAVAAGFEQRFALDTDQRSGICAADYHGNGSRMLALPLVTEVGRAQVRVAGYATFFLREQTSRHLVTAEFVGRF
jgi:hypothetical protein